MDAPDAASGLVLCPGCREQGRSTPIVAGRGLCSACERAARTEAATTPAPRVPEIAPVPRETRARPREGGEDIAQRLRAWGDTFFSLQISGAVLMALLGLASLIGCGFSSPELMATLGPSGVGLLICAGAAIAWAFPTRLLWQAGARVIELLERIAER